MVWNSDCRQHPDFGMADFEDVADSHESLEAWLRHDLASTIAQHRGGSDAAELADFLLRWSHEAVSILGLIDGCERAVRYGHKSISAIPFDTDDVYYDESESYGLFRRQDCPAFVYDQGSEYWDWLHPQYRWVFSVNGQ